MRGLKVLILMVIPALLFANEHDSATDIVPRTVNFIIFIGIIYYLLNDKIKEFLYNRTQSIQSQLQEVENKLQETKKQVEDAQAELDKAKQLATELVENAKNELDIIKEKITSKYDEEIAYISKSFEDRVELETKKAKKEVVEEVLDELLKDGLSLDQKDLTQIVMKKVA